MTEDLAQAIENVNLATQALMELPALGKSGGLNRLEVVVGSLVQSVRHLTKYLEDQENVTWGQPADFGAEMDAQRDDERARLRQGGE